MRRGSNNSILGNGSAFETEDERVGVIYREGSWRLGELFLTRLRMYSRLGALKLRLHCAGPRFDGLVKLGLQETTPELKSALRLGSS